MRILIIKNGWCDSDIERIICDINPLIKIEKVMSIDISEKIKSGTIKIDSYKGIIIMGGYQTLSGRMDKDYEYNYLNNLIEYIEEWIKRKIHILGICLGAQMIGEAVGCSTVKMNCPIKGYDHQIYWENKECDGNELCSKNMIKYFLCCHYDKIELTLSTINRNDMNIFSYYDESKNIPYIFKISNAYGVQCHPEITERVLKQIATMTNLDQSVFDFEKSNRHMIHKASNMFFTNWLKIISQDLIMK